MTGNNSGNSDDVGNALPSGVDMEPSGLIAHRGLSSAAPENTYAAFLSAYRHGFSWLETDVTLLGDNTAVLSHDYHLGRCCQIKTGSLADYHLGNYQQLDVGSWFADKFHTEKIPLLSQLFTWLDNWQMAANLELKVEDDNLQIWNNLVTTVAAEIGRMSFPQEKLLLSSFALPILYRARQLLPTIRLGYLLNAPSKAIAYHADRLNLYSIHIAEHLIMTELIEHCHQLKLKILAFTVNQPARIGELFKLGVDAIFSDNSYPKE